MEAHNLTNDTTQAYLFRKERLVSHPVGCVYMTAGSEDPSALFGGKWEMINGSFTIGTGITCSVWERTA